MSKNTAIQRVIEIMKFYNINVKSFSTRLKMANSTISSMLNKNEDVKGSFLEAICNEFPELDPTWLLTGKGKMILEKPQSFNDTGAEATYNVKKPPERPPCEDQEKTLLSKDEQVSMLIMQNDKLINIVEKHTATIYNLTTPIQLEVPKAETKSGGSVPKNVQG